MSESELIRVVRQLQADGLVQALVIRSIIESHPDRASLREQWSRFRACLLADTNHSKVAQPHLSLADQLCEQAVREWDDHLG